MSASTGTTPMRRWRSLLFIPALSTDKLAKAHERGADGLIIDLEDSVIVERKAEARPAMAAAVRQLAGQGRPMFVRLNAEPELWREDIAALPEGLVEAVLLPKVVERAAVDRLAGALASRFSVPPGIVGLIETPRGVLNAADIAAHPALVGLGFGAGDYAVALGVPITPTAVTGAAQHVVTCAHAFGLQCIGLAASVGEVADVEAYTESVRIARAMGFTGTVCIHPRQVPIVNRGFGPTDAEIAWARRVIEADAAASAAGQGAFLLDGQLVDVPVVVFARGVLEAAAR